MDEYDKIAIVIAPLLFCLMMAVIALIIKLLEKDREVDMLRLRIEQMLYERNKNRNR